MSEWADRVVAEAEHAGTMPEAMRPAARTVAVAAKAAWLASDDNRPVPPGPHHAALRDWIVLLQAERIAQGTGPSWARVPIAFAGHGTAPRIAWLELDAIENIRGAPLAKVHPADLVPPVFDPGFAGSMSLAFETAAALTGRPDTVGFWRVIPRTGEGPLPTVSIDGDSAGAAALRGWRHLLAGEVTDPRVLVMARLERRGKAVSLHEVESVREKTGLLAHAPGDIDTIAVVECNGRHIDPAVNRNRFAIRFLEVQIA